MKNYMKKIFILLLITAFFSCKKTQPNDNSIASKDILSNNQMIAILVDIHFIEADLFLKQNSGKDVKYYTQYYYNFLINKYHITYKQFKANIGYYSSNIKEFENIYEQVVTTMSQKQGEIYKK